MPTRPKGGGASGALTLRDDNIFANAIDRDDFFTTNPSRLVEAAVVVVNGQLQKYINSGWVNISQVIQGQTGTDAPRMTVQYSADGEGGWSATLNTGVHRFWRWSIDNGVSWVPVPPAKARYSASADGGGVPAPFELNVGANGKLQLLKNGALIQEQDEYGSWVIDSVTTGTGSLHFGDLHSVGSANENVVFKNEASGLNWFPTWSAISSDGQTTLDTTTRVHGAGVLSIMPSGVQGTATVDYNTTFTSSGNNAFLYFDTIPKEIYTGKCTLRVARQLNDIEVSSFVFDVNITDLVSTIRVPFKYPLWMVDGQDFTTTLKKEDGSFLQVLAGVNNIAPYRNVFYRTFTDEMVYHARNVPAVVDAIESLVGNEQLDASKLRNFPIASGTTAGVIKLGSTLSIDGSGVVEIGVSPTSILIVADEVARLLIAQSTGATLAIQQDNGFTYGIEANQDPSVSANWRQIGTVATNVVSFNGRNGGVVPATSDYSQSQIDTVNDDTGIVGRFGLDNTGIYWEPR